MTDEQVQKLLKEVAGNNPETMPKYVVLGDGSTYFYVKEEDRYALCKQATSLQEGIPTAKGTK